MNDRLALEQKVISFIQNEESKFCLGPDGITKFSSYDWAQLIVETNDYDRTKINSTEENFIKFLQKVKNHIPVEKNDISDYNKVIEEDFPRNEKEVLELFGKVTHRYLFPSDRKKWSREGVVLLVWTILKYEKLMKTTVSEFRDKDWTELASFCLEKDIDNLKFKWKYLYKSTTQRENWSKEEDLILYELIQAADKKNKWNEIAKDLYRISSKKIIRLGKHCRERWKNYLDPSLKKNTWTKDENLILIKLVMNLGTKWAKISKKLPGRNENTVKNRFHKLQSLWKFPFPEKSGWEEVTKLRMARLLEDYMKDSISFESFRYENYNQIQLEPSKSHSEVGNPAKIPTQTDDDSKAHQTVSTIKDEQNHKLGNNQQLIGFNNLYALVENERKAQYVPFLFPDMRNEINQQTFPQNNFNYTPYSPYREDFAILRPHQNILDPHELIPPYQQKICIPLNSQSSHLFEPSMHTLGARSYFKDMGPINQLFGGYPGPFPSLPTLEERVFIEHPPYFIPNLYNNPYSINLPNIFGLPR